MTRTRALVPVVFLFVAPAAWPQGMPLGPEFQINTYTTLSQRLPSVASDSSGNFVVVWQSDGQDGDSVGIFGQRYASSGAPLGMEFQVNSYTTLGQFFPAVASDPSGNFAVVWTGLGQDGTGILGQRYASSGAPLGTEFQVNTYTVNAQFSPSVAFDASGNFVVVWASNAQDGENFGVFGQRYASSGASLGPEFQINTYTPSDQIFPSVASDSSGNFVVAWNSYGQDGSSYGVFGQRYASSGVPLGPEFRVNTHTTDTQYGPSVAADSSGNFVVVWTGGSQDGAGHGVFGQLYAASGSPLGVEFLVNTYTTGYQIVPSVASDPSGDFVVVWTSSAADQDGSLAGVFGQRYASSGSPLGAEFQVNTYTTAFQYNQSVASDSSGNFVVVWVSSDQDGSSEGVFGQRYSEIVPIELMRFGVE